MTYSVEWTKKTMIDTGWGPQDISLFITPFEYDYLRIIHNSVFIVVKRKVTNWGPILDDESNLV